MSHEISGNNITLTRGDSLFLQITLEKNGEPYIPSEGSRIRFAMKRSYNDPDSEVLLEKQIPLDTLILEIEPNDTKPFPMGKTFVYDIELTDEHGHVDTFISGNFTIGKEVK